MRSTSQLVWRGFVLFLFGMLSTIVLSVLQSQRSSSSDHFQKVESKFGSRWWLPLACGAVSAFIGLTYPCLKLKNNDEVMKSQEWSHVLRCVAMFVGINEACTKVDFPSNLQLTISLAILSIGLWWNFDRTPIGFAMGVIVAVTVTLVTQMLVYHRICIYSEREFSYMKSWLPCIVFSGGITVANIGKQLAVNDFSDSERKSHAE